MPTRHVIVDGSNLATEGRSLPSLAQLDQAVREFMAENPGDSVTVVVDASFGHRIDPSEVPTFEEAEAAGELISPPAGAIGRGDAFLLRIAEKTGATVLSNDSFQEFHVEHEWLFDKGRLIGGKPVPGVGWIFMARTPVRGQKSREVVKEAKRKKRSEVAGPTNASPDESPRAGAASPTGLDLAASRPKGRGKKVERAIARATEEAVEPNNNNRSRRRKSGVPPADPVNEPLAFITFIAAHPLGAEVTGTVAEFSSHGAFVEADGARCYLPLSGMGQPPPRRAREVVGKGEERTFVVQALDPLRRGIELAMPGFAKIAGQPTDETVEAEIHPLAELVDAGADQVDGRASRGDQRDGAAAAPAKATRARKSAKKAASGPEPDATVPAPPPEPGPKRVAAALKVTGPAKKATAKKSKPAQTPAPVAAPEPTTAKRNPARKAASQVAKDAAGRGTKRAAGQTTKGVGAPSARKGAAASSASAAEPSPVKRVVPRKAAATAATEAAPPTPATKAPARKAPANKAGGGAGRRSPTKAPATVTPKKAAATATTASRPGASKAGAPNDARPAKKSATKKASAKEVPAKKAAAKKAASGRRRSSAS
jgi:hypothetical protein